MKNNHPSRLTFIKKIDKIYSLYKCSCGAIKPARHHFVNTDKIKSCGCLQREIVSSKRKENNIRKHPLYGIWWAMIYRCYKENNISYRNYGAKGVMVCDEWRNDFMSFYNWAIDNGWKKGLQIDKDKKAVNGIGLLYSPDTCSILTRSENNTIKKTTILFNYKGESRTLSWWSNKFKISVSTLYNRINKLNYSIEDAFNVSNKPKKYEYNGEWLTIKEWSEKLNIHKNTIRYRVNNNLPILI